MSRPMFRGLLPGTGATTGGSFTPDTSAYLHYHAMAITPQADGSDLPYTAVLDQSGNARHATGRSVGASKWIRYATNAFGTGKPGIYFGGESYINLPSLSSLTAGEIFIVVYQTVDPPSSSNATSIGHFGTGAFDAILFPWTDNTIYDGFGSTSRKTTVNPTPSLAAVRLYNIISASGEWTSRLDTTQLFTTGTNTVGFPTNPTFGGGALDGSGVLTATTNGLFGYIGEIRLFSSKRTTPQRTAIEADIKAVWGLTGY